jgi:hypothetical protein
VKQISRGVVAKTRDHRQTVSLSRYPCKDGSPIPSGRIPAPLKDPGASTRRGPRARLAVRDHIRHQAHTAAVPARQACQHRPQPRTLRPCIRRYRRAYWSRRSSQ